MADPDYRSLNVYPETHKEVLQIRNDNRLSSIDAAVSMLLEVYADAEADGDDSEESIPIADIREAAREGAREGTKEGMAEL